MTRVLVAALVGTSILAACSTDPYTGRPDVGTRIGTGVAAGAVLGGVAGAALGGHAVTGVAAGMIAGGAIGAATTTVHGRRYYRDTRGYCYYVDQSGQPKYDYNVRC